MDNFATRLKELRMQYRLTQTQLAERLGVSKSTISYYELLERTPSPDILVRLAEVFNVSLDYLMGLNRKQIIEISNLNEEDIKPVKDIINYLSNIMKIKRSKRKQSLTSNLYLGFTVVLCILNCQLSIVRY